MSSSADMPENDTNNQEIQRIFQAAQEHDNETIKQCIKTLTFSECEAVDVLDPTTGRCPLHFAIQGGIKNQKNGKPESDRSTNDLEQSASGTVKLLLENGAIWNQLDQNDETPGCLARRLGLQYLYQLMVDAGVRAEVLLNRLEGYEQLDDEENSEGETMENDTTNAVEQDDEEAPALIVVETKNTEVNSSDYLASRLSFAKDKLLDDQSNGVMMEWERGIMKRSADALMDEPNKTILNIGAGMLIFDSIVQESENKPVSHHIVEAHPDVLSEMRAKGWYEKPGVFIHEDQWQFVLPNLVAQNETFDAIYFDTFAEPYSQFREFFQEQVIGLLKQDGKWSFFNGMGADRQISYDVYQQVVELDLFEAGFDIEWQEMEVPILDKEWEGVKRKYWNIQTYRLPLCKFMD